MAAIGATATLFPFIFTWRQNGGRFRNRTTRVFAGERTLQCRSRTHGSRATHVGRLRVCRALGGHGHLHPELHAGGGAYRRWDVLAASACNHPARKFDCAGADDSECARRSEVRHSLPGVRAFRVRRARRKHSVRGSRAGGLRLVRHSNVDWRASDPYDSALAVERLARCARRRVDLLLCILGHEYLHRAARLGFHQVSRRLGRAFPDCRFDCSAGVGLHARRRMGADVSGRKQIQISRRIPSLLYCFPHRHGGFLVHASVKHLRFHALCAEPARAGARPGAGPAVDNDAV